MERLFEINEVDLSNPNYIILSYFKKEWAEAKLFYIDRSNFEWWLFTFNKLQKQVIAGFIDGNPYYESQDISISEYWANSETIEADVYDYMHSIYWHDTILIQGF